MPWYRTGTVTVTNGSTAVTGVGCLWVGSVLAGQGFVGPDLNTYEIDTVNSNTSITLKSAYAGSTAGAQAYAILPTQALAGDLAAVAQLLITDFGGVRDGVGQGMFADGTAATPGIRSANDQDTGWYRIGSNSWGWSGGGTLRVTFSTTALTTTVPVLAPDGTAGAPALSFSGDPDTGFYRPGANTIGWATGGTARGAVDSSGNIGIGNVAPSERLHLTAATFPRIRFEKTSVGDWYIGNLTNGGSSNSFGLAVGVTNVMTFDTSGNMGVGATTPAARLHVAGATVGATSLRVVGYSGAELLIDYAGGGSHYLDGSTFTIRSIGDVISTEFISVAGTGGNVAACGMRIKADGTTSRSINAGGTVNAAGADYAEYMRKALGCGTILKGDVCGVDADGNLTKTWAAAISYVVKSTDPSLVGGDVWGSEDAVGPRPAEPILVLPIYEGPDAPDTPVAPVLAAVPVDPGPSPEEPPVPERGEEEGDIAWAQRVNIYVIDHAQWLKDCADHQGLVDAYEGAPAIEAANAAAVAAHADAMTAYEAAFSEHQTALEAHAVAVDDAEQAHAEAVTAYQGELAVWEVVLEEARQTVDRIAFSGQVPVNFEGDCDVGDYLVAVAAGAGIGLIAVPAEEIDLDQYRRRVGRVWAIREGRPWVDVQHG